MKPKEIEKEFKSQHERLLLVEAKEQAYAEIMNSISYLAILTHKCVDKMEFVKEGLVKIDKSLNDTDPPIFIKVDRINLRQKLIMIALGFLLAGCGSLFFAILENGFS